MEVTFEIVSNCHGIVEQLYQEEGSYVCECEILCLIKTSGGKLVEVPATFSGYLDGYHVSLGERVGPDALMARLTENAKALCASSD